jgi:pyruvate,water dikinase
MSYRLVASLSRSAPSWPISIRRISPTSPSDYPEFARFLVSCGIDSISLNPDTVLKTTQEIVKMEQPIRQREAAA